MPETNFLTPTQENPPAGGKKPKKYSRERQPAGRQGSASGGKNIRKKKIDKSPFQFNENININPIMPKAGPRIKEKLPTVKRSLPLQAGEAMSIYRKIAFSFVALTVILVAAVLYFGFSKVTLIIVPSQEKITDSLSLGIVDKANDFSLNQGEIFGVVRPVPVEQSRTFTSSGKEILGEEVSGQVTIINNYMKNQPLVATTRLLSQDKKLFRLKNTVNVPAGGRVNAEVYADEVSPSLAIGSSKFTIPGLWAGLQDKIYAESNQPMKYSEKVKYFIKQSDIDKAVSELKQDLLTNAKKEASLAFKEYDQTILEVDNNSVSQEVQGKVGEEKEKFTIKMKTKVTVVAFKSSDVRTQAEAKLTARLADDKDIVEFNQSDITYNLTNADLSHSTASVNANFTAKVTLKDSAGIIKKNNLAGKNLQEVKTYLSSLPEVAGYEIKFFPSFIKKMPNLVDRIEIVIKK